MSQGFQRCDDFDILACGVPLQTLLLPFFFLCPRQLKSFVFKLLCCSRSPCSPYSCVLPLLPPLDSERQERTIVLPNNGGGQLKKLLCAINVSDSPPNLRHLQREAAALPAATRPRFCALLPPRTSPQRQPPSQWNKEKSLVSTEGERTSVFRCCCSVRSYALARVCVPHFAASPSEKKKKKTDLLHSETLLAGGARYEQALARRVSARTGCNFDWGRASFKTSTCVSYCLSFLCTHFSFCLVDENVTGGLASLAALYLLQSSKDGKKE